MTYETSKAHRLTLPSLYIVYKHKKYNVLSVKHSFLQLAPWRKVHHFAIFLKPVQALPPDLPKSPITSYVIHITCDIFCPHR
ncbi:MAG: hypothetical protein CL920_22925 [Deltaproteobacteria bacterium]|nr:hypothetical protein [Deltaproteobacteria bacterium]